MKVFPNLIKLFLGSQGKKLFQKWGELLGFRGFRWLCPYF